MAANKVSIIYPDLGSAYDVGSALNPVNLSEFDKDAELVIDQVLDPIIMHDGKVIQQGTVILKNKERKKFITDALNILIDKFPNKNNRGKPKIYFQKEIVPLYPKNIPLPGALFYSPELSPWANDMVKSAIGSNEPFFAFFNDLHFDTALEDAVHEFVHYLQSCGKSGVPYAVLQQGAEYYKYYYENKKANKQIYRDAIQEVEAYGVQRYFGRELTRMMNEHLIIKNAKTAEK